MRSRRTFFEAMGWAGLGRADFPLSFNWNYRFSLSRDTHTGGVQMSPVLQQHHPRQEASAAATARVLTHTPGI